MTLSDLDYSFHFELSFCDNFLLFVLSNQQGLPQYSGNQTFSGISLFLECIYMLTSILVGGSPTRRVSMFWNSSEVMLALDGQMLFAFSVEIPAAYKSLYIRASPASQCAATATYPSLFAIFKNKEEKNLGTE